MNTSPRVSVSNGNPSVLSNVSITSVTKTKFTPIEMPRVWEVEFYAWTPNAMDMYYRMNVTKQQAYELLGQLEQIINEPN